VAVAVRAGSGFGFGWCGVSIRPFTTPAPTATYVDAERRAGIQEALDLVRQGRPGYAFFKLARSVERQNRLAGNGTIAIAACPCGRGDCLGGGRR
jgi:hypothetical protein